MIDSITQHEKEVDKLKQLECELVDIIADTNNMALLDKFTELKN